MCVNVCRTPSTSLSVSHVSEFQPCGAVVNLDVLVHSCKSDVCLSGLSNMSCSVFAQAAEACKKAGFCVEWQHLTNGTCSKCPLIHTHTHICTNIHMHIRRHTYTHTHTLMDAYMQLNILYCKWNMTATLNGYTRGSYNTLRRALL